MIFDPQQEIYSAMLTGLRALGYSVHDGFLPPDDTTYPFIYMSDSTQTDSITKSTLKGQVTLTFDVWHNDYSKRGIVSQMLLSIKTLARSIERTEHFGWYVRNIDQQILPDTTTKTPLLHGILFVTFRF